MGHWIGIGEAQYFVGEDGVVYADEAMKRKVAASVEVLMNPPKQEEIPVPVEEVEQPPAVEEVVEVAPPVEPVKEVVVKKKAPAKKKKPVKKKKGKR